MDLWPESGRTWDARILASLWSHVFARRHYILNLQGISSPLSYRFAVGSLDVATASVETFAKNHVWKLNP